jgi:hypothetical protein
LHHHRLFHFQDLYPPYCLRWLPHQRVFLFEVELNCNGVLEQIFDEESKV